MQAALAGHFDIFWRGSSSYLLLLLINYYLLLLFIIIYILLLLFTIIIIIYYYYYYYTMLYIYTHNICIKYHIRSFQTLWSAEAQQAAGAFMNFLHASQNDSMAMVVASVSSAIEQTASWVCPLQWLPQNLIWVSSGFIISPMKLTCLAKKTRHFWAKRQTQTTVWTYVNLFFCNEASSRGSLGISGRCWGTGRKPLGKGRCRRNFTAALLKLGPNWASDQ